MGEIPFFYFKYNNIYILINLTRLIVSQQRSNRPNDWDIDDVLETPACRLYKKGERKYFVVQGELVDILRSMYERFSLP